MRMRCLIFALGLLAALVPVQAAADPVVEIESRGQKVRAVLLKPANPKGAVILFAGGDGRLDITPAGDITKLRFNQLVRTRALYASAGYATLVPDIAPSFKVGASGVVDLYRASRAFAQDVGAMVKYLRGIVSKPIVAVVKSRLSSKRRSAARSTSSVAAQISGPMPSPSMTSSSITLTVPCECPQCAGQPPPSGSRGRSAW